MARYRWSKQARRCISLLVVTMFLSSSLMADTTLPIITHNVDNEEIPAGSRYTVEAQVTDDGTIDDVRLNFKLPDQPSYSSRQMLPIESNGFQAVLQPDEVREPAIQYYITAQDAAGNQQSRGFAFDPLQIRVGPAALASSSDAGESSSSGNKRVWYLVGAVAVAGLLASLTNDDPETVPNGCPCVGLEYQ